ncbi:hypothetical protein C0993_007827 [Termitomyces sp. T159_Od127]|nr:hypothetical protein C0993_007827 [Termitomyces sp. T159_Od127]
MFKRVKRRQRKKEEEEELGLDEDMKQVLGMNDTDSEESASDTDDSESGSSEGSRYEGVYVSNEERVFEQIEGEESEKETSLPVITVQEALRDPVYVISLKPNVKGCILCRGKFFRDVKTVEVHTLASSVNSQTNAWDLLAQQEADKKVKQSLDAPSEISNREKKRRSQAALRKMRRDKQRAKAKAKKAAAMESSVAPTERQTAPPIDEPPKKKRKCDGSTSSPLLALESVQSSLKKEVKSVAAIARSTSDRAKAARAKATKVDVNH